MAASADLFKENNLVPCLNRFIKELQPNDPEPATIEYIEPSKRKTSPDQPKGISRLKILRSCPHTEVMFTQDKPLEALAQEAKNLLNDPAQAIELEAFVNRCRGYAATDPDDFCFQCPHRGLHVVINAHDQMIIQCDHGCKPHLFIDSLPTFAERFLIAFEKFYQGKTDPDISQGNLTSLERTVIDCCVRIKSLLATAG
jgi:hypothetical protein